MKRQNPTIFVIARCRDDNKQQWYSAAILNSFPPRCQHHHKDSDYIQQIWYSAEMIFNWDYIQQRFWIHSPLSVSSIIRREIIFSDVVLLSSKEHFAPQLKDRPASKGGRCEVWRLGEIFLQRRLSLITKYCKTLNRKHGSINWLKQ